MKSARSLTSALFLVTKIVNGYVQCWSLGLEPPTIAIARAIPAIAGFSNNDYDTLRQIISAKEGMNCTVIASVTFAFKPNFGRVAYHIRTWRMYSSNGGTGTGVQVPSTRSWQENQSFRISSQQMPNSRPANWGQFSVYITSCLNGFSTTFDGLLKLRVTSAASK